MCLNLLHALIPALPVTPRKFAMSKTFLTLFTLAAALLAADVGYAAPHKKDGKALHYFVDKKADKVGVRDRAGKVVVPAQYSNIGWSMYEEPVRGAEIEFIGSTRNRSDGRENLAQPAGDVYDRQGRFLYTALWYDNGLDFWEEGMRRFVENGKVGFVDRLGRKAVPAQWDYAEPFEYGYATVYTGGWKRQFDPSGEHWRIVPTSAAARSHVINRQGGIVAGSRVRQHAQDYARDGLYYPYPFAYNAFEHSLVNKMNRLDVLNDLHLMPYVTDAPRETLTLRFEITERPLAHFPYYTLQAFDRAQSKQDDMMFFADRAGRIFYREYDRATMTPLKTWLIRQLQEAQDYMRRHPDHPFRFNARQRLQEVRRATY